ncbi:hypothetical protein H1R20_g11089, partial [Candolleomyces eurysporus]
MGRPRLYHTPEEKKAANRLKSKKHYDSNRDLLLRRRRRAARERRESLRDRSIVEGQSKPKDLPSKTGQEKRPKTKLEVIQEQVQRFSRQFETILAGKTAAGYLALICVGLEIHYEAGHILKAKDFVMGKEVELRKVLRALEKYRDMARDLAGSGEEWKGIEAIATRVRQVISWLDGLLCMAMVDPADLVDRFHAKQLEFQIDS